MHALKFRVATVLCLWTVAGQPFANAGDPGSKNIYPATLKGTALIQIGQTRGTGWIVDRSRRLLITNHHVVGNAPFPQVFFPLYKDGKPVAEVQGYAKEIYILGRVIDSDPKRDLAVIQLQVMPPTATQLKMAADSAGPGDRVHSIGNPGQAFALWVYSLGSVRQVARQAITYQNNQKVDAVVVMTQAPINPGDSGGPIVNDAGEVVAVTSGTSQKGNLISFGIDISEVRAFLKETEKWLGAKTKAEFIQRANYYDTKGMFALAVDDYTSAIALDRQDGTLYRSRGIVQSKLGQTDKAIADFVVAVRLDPKDAVALGQRGIAFYSKAEDQQAIVDLNNALKLKPGDTLFLCQRAMALQRQGKIDDALKDADAAIAAAPKAPLGYGVRGDIFFAKEDYDAAIKDYSESIRLGLFNAYYGRARTYAKKLAWDQAISDFDQGYKLTPASVLNDSAGVCGRGDAYLAKRQLDKALQDYDLAIRINPNLAAAYSGRGAVLYIQKKYDEAASECTKALALYPKEGRAYLERGRSLLNVKTTRLEDVTLDAVEAVQLLPKDPWAHNLLGICHVRKGEHDKAIASYSQAMNLLPKEAVFPSNRGQAYYSKGDYDHAIEDLSAALKILPAYAIALQFRSKAYEKKGDQENAKKDLEAAKKLNPNLK